MKRLLLYTHELSYTGAPASLLRMTKILVKYYDITVWSKTEGDFLGEFEKIGITVDIVPEMEIYHRVDVIKNYDLAIANTIASWKFYSVCREHIRTIWYIREASYIPKILGNNTYWKSTLISADNIYVVSEYAAEFLKKQYELETNIVHNCVEDYYDIKQDDYDKTDDRLVIIMLGTITERKGYDIAFDAFSELPDEARSRFIIKYAGQLINRGKDEYTCNLMQFVRRFENVEFLGEITDKRDIIDLYREADIVLVPSRDESCSLVALEGAMMAKPLIVSSHVGAKYIVDENNGYIFDNDDVESLKKVFLNIAQKTKDELKEMGMNSRKKYGSMASMEKYKKDILGMVEKEINKPFGPYEMYKNSYSNDINQAQWIDHVEKVVKKKENQIKKIQNEKDSIDILLKKTKEELKIKNEILKYYYASKEGKIIHENNVRIIENSVFFDKEWYESRYTDWMARYKSSAEYYYYEGWIRGDDPSAAFSSRRYQREYGVSICPLVHYEKNNNTKYTPFISDKAKDLLYQEKLVNESTYFDAKWYVSYYNYLHICEDEAAVHYINEGYRAGYNPSKFFSTMIYKYFYLVDTKEQDICPLVHYELVGKRNAQNNFNVTSLRRTISNKTTWRRSIATVCATLDTVNQLYATVMSLLFQSIICERIIIIIPLESFPNKMDDLPLNLQDIFALNYVEVFWTHDYGDYIKFLPAIKMYSDYTLLTLSAGSVYKKDFIKELSKKCNDYPGEICCLDIYRVYWNDRNETFDCWDINTKEYDVSLLNIMKSREVVYPKGFFSGLENLPVIACMCGECFSYIRAIEKAIPVRRVVVDKHLIENRKYNRKSDFNRLNEFIDDQIKRNLHEAELSQYDNNYIRIIVPAEKDNTKYNGDYYYCRSIEKELQKRGYNVDFCMIGDWDTPFCGRNVLVLRGPLEYKCKPFHNNIMWNISHPKDICISEYISYNTVCIASKKMVEKVRRAIQALGYKTKVISLLQCTDKDFYMDIASGEYKHDILFIGMNHAEGRKTINDLFPTMFELSLYGPHWEKTKFKNLCRRTSVYNQDLPNFYNSAFITLNDTRPEMFSNGFVPNRLFDVFIAGGFVVTEYSDDLVDIFDGNIAMYDGTNEGLNETISYYKHNMEEREKIIKEQQDRILKNHLFSNRVDVIQRYFV